MKYIVIFDAADGTKSAAGPFVNLRAAEGWAARLEYDTNGEFSGMAVELENPAVFMTEAIMLGEVR